MAYKFNVFTGTLDDTGSGGGTQLWTETGTTLTPTTAGDDVSAGTGSLIAPTDLWIGAKTTYMAGWTKKKIYSYSYNITSVTNGVLRISFTNDSDFGTFANSDGSDLRFGGLTSGAFPYVKKYYLKSGSNATGIFDVNIGTTGVGGNIYIWYGNSTATDASDGVATYGPRYVKAYTMEAGSSADPKNYAVSGSDDLTVSGPLYWSASGQYSKTGSTYTGYISIPTTGMNFATTGAVVFNYVNNGGNYLNRTLLSFSQPSTGSNHNHMMLYVGSDGNLRYFYMYNGGFASYSLGSFNPSINHTIGLVKTGTNTWRAYLDGNSVYAGLPGYVTAPTLMYWGAQTQTESSYGNAGGVESAISGLWAENNSATSNYDPTKLFVQSGSAGSAQMASPLTGEAPVTGGIGKYINGILVEQTTSSGSNMVVNNAHYSAPVGQFATLYETNSRSSGSNHNLLYSASNDGQVVTDGNTYADSTYYDWHTYGGLVPGNMSVGQIPYHDGTRLAGNISNMSYDSVLHRMGINTDSQIHPFQVQGGNTVGDPSSASVSANYYSVPSDPTSSSGESVYFNYEAGVANLAGIDTPNPGVYDNTGNYYNTGLHHYYRIWTVNVQGHRSNSYYAFDWQDDGANNIAYHNYLDWTTYSVPNTYTYYIEHSLDAWATWEYISTYTTYLDDIGYTGWTAGSATFDVPYKTQVQHDYQSLALNGIAYSNGNVTWSGTPTLSIADTTNFYTPYETSGSGYEQLGQPLIYYVFARLSPVTGTSIYSPSGVSNRLYLSSNSGNYTDVRLDWDAVLSASDYFVVLYDGSNYYYQVASGNSLVDSGPSYWTAWTGPTAPANDLVWYTNSVTPPSGNSKIFKQDSEHGWIYNYYRNGDISTFTDLFTNINTPWSAGSKVQTGYQASGQTITTRIYSKRLASGVGIFSTGYTEVAYTDNNNDGSYFTITWNWTAGANADGYRQLRDINSGGFNYYYDIATNYFSNDDATLWVGGTPAITPNSNGYGLFVDSNLRPGTNAPVPANSSDTGTTGTVAYDQNYVYYCYNTNQWVRSPLSSF